MNKETFDNLNLRAEKQLGKEIPVRILNPNDNDKTIVVNHKFIQVSRGFGIGEQQDKMNFKAYGLVKSNDGNIEKFPLKEIVEYLENQEK